MTADDLARMIAASPYHRFLGIAVTAADAEAATATLRLPWRAEFERAPGSAQWHGGVLAALVDIAGDCALMIRLGRALPTCDLRIDYLRPAIATDLVARARTIRAGRTLGLVDVEIAGTDGRLVAVGRASYLTRPPEDTP
jgi:uncharacterized protein (TIGR00369 family)